MKYLKKNHRKNNTWREVLRLIRWRKFCFLHNMEGAHFYLWAGKRDRSRTTVTGSRAEDMKQAKLLIERLGGIVDVLRIGPEGHGGFNHIIKYQREAFDLWRKQKENASNPEFRAKKRNFFK
jgi:hypothetical protein